MNNYQKNILLISVVSIVILVSGFMLIRSLLSSNDQNESATAKISTDNEVRSGTPADNTSTKQTADLQAVGNYQGSGEATRDYVDNKFLHEVTVAIKDPAKGKFYEGWLVKPGGFISTGKLAKNNDGQYVLAYSSPDDLRDYKSVVITEETEANGLDNKPEAHVLEGVFEL